MGTARVAPYTVAPYTVDSNATPNLCPSGHMDSSRPISKERLDMAQTETHPAIIEVDLDHAQYWPGVGSYGGPDDYAGYVGTGGTAYEAVEDALEQAAIQGCNVDDIPNDHDDIATSCDLCDYAAECSDDDRSECEMTFYAIVWLPLDRCPCSED